MSYLEDFKVQITNRDYSKFWQLWEEYCADDTVDVEEFAAALKFIKTSDFAKSFGQYVETALPLLNYIQDFNQQYEILKLLIDLQTTHSAKLAEMALSALQQKYGHQPDFNDRLRMVGLRTKDNFQGALANYDLLAHMAKGKFVYHSSGWGAGQIVDLSPVREQLTVEFEHLAGLKHFTFSNAFKALVPLASDSFLAHRFSNPDDLEQKARDNPVEVIKMLLRDLGPKTASEIKDELCGLVIPEQDWSKWWQNTRAKVKKDTMIDTPESLKEPFKLHKAEVSHEERFHKTLAKGSNIEELIQSTYSFARDNAAMLKKADLKNSIQEKLEKALKQAAITTAEKVQIYMLLESHFEYPEAQRELEKILKSIDNVEAFLNQVEIIAYKKRLLALIREQRADWDKIYLDLLFTPQQSLVRESLLKDLNQGPQRKLLEEKLQHLIRIPLEAPEFFLWYFQKVVGKNKEALPFSDKKGLCTLFESVLILLSLLDSKPEYKDLSKKIYVMLTSKRFEVVRHLLEGASLEFVKEFLLLVSKCQAFSDHDQKILVSLAEVVHPSLAIAKGSGREEAKFDKEALWTTEAGYIKNKNRIEQISHVEIVENAREIEAARALGDLRENSEYKFALERRSRLNSELRHLSNQMNKARLITSIDVPLDEIGIGSVVELKDSKGQQIKYTILGPWDADPEAGILSYQSKLAEEMMGHKVGETFGFREEQYQILSVKSYLEL